MSTSVQQSSGVVDERDEARFEYATVDADGTTECTIFPAQCPDADLVTNWITARGDAFVALDEMA